MFHEFYQVPTHFTSENFQQEKDLSMVQEQIFANYISHHESLDTEQCYETSEGNEERLPILNESCPTADSLAGLTREERRRRRRATLKYRIAHATRERVRVEAFNVAFAQLRQLLPTLPPDKKLSKIEILRLAICYIAYLTHVIKS